MLHVACLLIMFLKGRLAMPCIKHEGVRHATFSFCAFVVCFCSVQGAGKANGMHSIVKNSEACTTSRLHRCTLFR